MAVGKRTLWVITGCTAVGKTKYAIDFARANNGEIISCDSLLVYKHMDIGTAKPTTEERELVRHHCVDLVDPSENFDISLFVETAKNARNSIISLGRNVVIVGGSGFYLKSFFYPVVDGIKIPSAVRKFVDEQYKSAGLDGLVTMLISANDGICPCIDIRNPRRVAAALGRCLAGGKTFDEIGEDFKATPSPFADCEKHTIFLEREKEDLEIRVRERAKKMVADGLIGEVQHLLANYKHLSVSAACAIGYRETINWLQHPTTEENLASEIAGNTMKLIKKQKTWLKKQIPIDERILLR
jgi:tRNA dimethylallyltransferase